MNMHYPGLINAMWLGISYIGTKIIRQITGCLIPYKIIKDCLF